MDKQGKLIFSIISVAAIAIATIFTVFTSSSEYSGEIAFYNNEDYQEFKEAIASPDVSIVEVQELSSEPPIIVKFEVITSNDYEFMWGEKASITTDLLILYFCMTIVIIIAWLWQDAASDNRAMEKEEKQ